MATQCPVPHLADLHRHLHAHPHRRLQAAWIALLFVGYGFQRGLCAAGLPYDCDSADAADVFNSLTLLAFLGGALAWLAGVTNPARFDWLVAPRRTYLWIVYLAILPAYSGIASIPAMRVSLATMDEWGPAPIILKVVGELAGCGVACVLKRCARWLQRCVEGSDPSAPVVLAAAYNGPCTAAGCLLHDPCPNVSMLLVHSRRDWCRGRGLPHLAGTALRLHRGRRLGVCRLRQQPRPACCGVPCSGCTGGKGRARLALGGFHRQRQRGQPGTQRGQRDRQPGS